VADEPEPAPLSDDRPQSVDRAVDSLLAAFPGSTVVEDWQQIGHTEWADRRTGLIVTEHPAGAVPLIRG
jgi:hypothetical protein